MLFKEKNEIIRREMLKLFLEAYLVVRESVVNNKWGLNCSGECLIMPYTFPALSPEWSQGHKLGGTPYEPIQGLQPLTQ
jgi:hypothetical protein